jgi:hypothetical protein
MCYINKFINMICFYFVFFSPECITLFDQSNRVIYFKVISFVKDCFQFNIVWDFLITVVCLACYKKMK